MVTQDFTANTKELIDNLKGVCTSYGLGNDGNEFKIITQVFLYKFMNDKFGFEVKELDPKLKNASNWEQEIAKYSDKQYEMLLMRMSPDSARLKREHFLANLHNRQNKEEFAKYFDDTLRDIAIFNNEIFSVKTGTGAKVTLFDELSNYITDSSQRDNFCKALINQLINFSFEKIFQQKFDFFSTIFEYLIKDYNKDGGGKYAEYYTPHAVAKIMASILVDKPVSNVTCYDPSAGSGTLLMNLAHAIGEDRCTIYSQDISQKSSSMLRLNLILNNLVHSIQNIIQGNTLLTPYHKTGEKLMPLTILPPIRPLSWTSAITGMTWTQSKIITAFLQVSLKLHQKVRTKWQSTCSLSSTSCFRFPQKAKPQSLYQPDLLPHKAVLKRRFGKSWCLKRCSAVWSPCRAISSPPPAPMYRFCF